MSPSLSISPPPVPPFSSHLYFFSFLFSSAVSLFPFCFFISFTFLPLSFYAPAFSPIFPYYPAIYLLSCLTLSVFITLLLFLLLFPFLFLNFCFPSFFFSTVSPPLSPCLTIIFSFFSLSLSVFLSPFISSHTLLVFTTFLFSCLCVLLPFFHSHFCFFQNFSPPFFSPPSRSSFPLFLSIFLFVLSFFCF